MGERDAAPAGPDTPPAGAVRSGTVDLVWSGQVMDPDEPAPIGQELAVEATGVAASVAVARLARLTNGLADFRALWDEA
jgi:hypothetical protein